MAARGSKQKRKPRRKQTAAAGFGLPGFRILLPAAMLAGAWVAWHEPLMTERPNEPARRTASAAPRANSSAPVKRDAIAIPVPRPQIALIPEAARPEQKRPVALVPPKADSKAEDPIRAMIAATPPDAGGQPAAPPAGKLLYASAETELKAQASGQAETIAIVPRGSALRLLASRDEWRLVSTSRRLGWVHRDQLEESTGSIGRPKAGLRPAAGLGKG